jgi:5-methylcytosine-specific restriction endonuclease McrA
MPTAPKTYRAAQAGHETSRAGTSAERGYGGQWKRISRLKRQQCPVCEDCEQEPSTQVHHKVRFNGVDDPLRTNWGNLMALCGDCHRRRHR